MGKYPIVHLIVLIIGSIILLALKRKFKKIRYVELIIIFILMVVLISIFTDTGIDLVKRFINFIQID
jgi:hypothetical protein